MQDVGTTHASLVRLGRECLAGAGVYDVMPLAITACSKEGVTRESKQIAFWSVASPPVRLLKDTSCVASSKGAMAA